MPSFSCRQNKKQEQGSSGKNKNTEDVSTPGTSSVTTQKSFTGSYLQVLYDFAFFAPVVFLSVRTVTKSEKIIIILGFKITDNYLNCLLNLSAMEN